MSEQYRIVHFMPDPFAGAQLPVAALVSRAGAVSVVKAEALPSQRCVGSPESVGLLNLVLEGLRDAETVDALPASVGPQVFLGKPRLVPEGVPDPALWVRTNVLPRATEPIHGRLVRVPRRSTYGRRYLSRFGVREFLHSRFRPARVWGDAHLLQPISHWVGSDATGLLLMEPLAPKREPLEDQVQEVATRFSAYRWHLSRAAMLPAKERVLIAYLLPGGLRKERHSAIAALEGSANDVVDTANPRARASFLERIREVGTRAEVQTTLPS